MEKKYPFKFLDAYTREDKDFYFGRDEEISQLYEMVFQTNLLLVYGGSGVGKSSLIQCGLASRFDTHDWQSIFVRRGSDINESLDAALVDAGGEVDDDDGLDWLDQDWSAPDASVAEKTEKPLLAKRINTIYLKNFRPIYLIFDQFEELFIFGDHDEQTKFYQSIKSLLSSEQQVKVIFLIREEYLGNLYEFERVIPQLLRKKIRIEPMNIEKVIDIVMGIARAKNQLITIKQGEEREFAEKVFDRLKGGENRITIELPYLQVFFDKLYMSITHDETRTTPAEFSLESLENIGSIGDVLRNMLDEQVAEVVNKLNLPTDSVWKFLSAFVSLEGTKDPKTFKEVVEIFSDRKDLPLRELLSEFVNRRILRKSQKDFSYEIAHDTLAKQISLKRSDDEIALLEMKRMIQGMASLDEEAREYFSEKQMVLITPMIDQLHLNERELDWVDRSVKHIQKLHDEEDAKRNRELYQTKRRLRGAIAMLFIVLIAFVYAGIQTIKASREKLKSEILLADNQRQQGFFLIRHPDSTAMFRADTVFKVITSNQVARPEDFGYLGACYHYFGDYENASQMFKKCLLASEKGKRYEERFDIEYEEKKRDEDRIKAEDEKKKHNKYQFKLKTKMLTPEQASAEANRLMALCSFEKQDFEQAYAYAHKATEMMPTDYDAWFDLSHYAIFVSKFDESVAAAQNALELDNNRKEAVRYLALAKALDGEKEQAKAIYDEYFNTIFKGPASSYSKNPLLQHDTTWCFSTPLFFDDLDEVKQYLKNVENMDFVVNLLNGKIQQFIDGIQMIPVKGGQFTMGSSTDPNAIPHQVLLSDFAIGKYEVDQSLWETVMGYNPSYYKGDKLPVENITWFEADLFTKRLSAITRLHYRLPTESEWEYAAMGGGQSKGYTYSGFNDIRGHANYKSKTLADIGHPVDVTRYEPNELGIHNMSGNVWEWCSDWFSVYRDSYPTIPGAEWDPNEPLVNPQGKIKYSEYDDKSLRGGSYDSEQGRCTVRNRHHHHPGMKGNFYGMRLALECE